MKLEIEYLPISELKPYERNNKKHADFDILEIAKSIEKYGMNDPIGIWKGNVIVEGHGRFEACKKLGLTEVPCIHLDHLTDKQRREYAILHNKTAELAEYDFDNLALELDELDFSEFDFEFGGGEEEREQSPVKEVPVPEVNEEDEPTAKVGEMYKLGDHILMCGDSTNAEMVKSLMSGGAC